MLGDQNQVDALVSMGIQLLDVLRHLSRRACVA